MGYQVDWHPIKTADDLPKAGQDVLVTVQGYDRCFVDHVVSGTTEWYGAGFLCLVVLAWAPMPTAYDPNTPGPVDIRAAILALAGELDGQAIVGMGVKDIVKRMREIAG